MLYPATGIRRVLCDLYHLNLLQKLAYMYLLILRNIETQTKRDGSSNVPKPSVFIAGLRGCDSTRTKMTKVDLTLDVDQT